MVSLARQIAPGDSLHGSQSRSLLAQLRDAHEQLIREMENLDRITLGPLGDGRELTAARWQLSQASLRRRTLSARIAAFLGDQIDEGDGRCLRVLQSENQVAVSRSARHIYDWTTQSIRHDWPGYGRASREIRMHMKAHIQLEQQIICPLLERLADQGV